MKKLLLIGALAISSIGFAQSGLKEDVDIIQSVYGKSKKDLVGAYMNLAEPQAAAFWAIYDAYEVERKKLGQEKIELINQYAKASDKLTDENADKIATAMLANSAAYEKLFSKYYKKAKGAIGALGAAKFIQLEVALQTAIRSEIQNSIPFVGELEQMKKS